MNDAISMDEGKNNVLIASRTFIPKSAGYSEYSVEKEMVFYLSDLHIEGYLDGDGILKKQVNKLVDKLVKNTEILYAYCKYREIESDIEQMDSWILHRSSVEKRLKALNSKLKLTKKDSKEKESLEIEFARLDADIDHHTEPLRKLKERTFKGISESALSIGKKLKRFCVLLAGDIADSIELSSLFYHRLREWLPENRILTVLGNHELSEFPSVEKAVAAYREMLSREGIILLHNNGIASLDYSEKNDPWVVGQGITYWPRQYLISEHLCFFGGVGFNKYDEIYNANTIISSVDLQGNVAKEKEECNKFVEAYKKALQFAWVKSRVLVVLSHYPLRNWMRESECEHICYYFYGHNHRNESFESNGAYIFADNQIGYDSKKMAFRHVDLFGLFNPFYDYEDGIHDIFVEDYQQFYRFAGEGVIGSGTIENYIKNGCKLTMIKKNNYYAFWLVSKTSIYICRGGSIKKINTYGRPIKYYYDRFDEMVNKYIEMLTPLRTFLEELAVDVKRLGGEGRVHGLIVDYDFTHHIMLSNTGKDLYFYYSPLFGYAIDLKNITGLLTHTGKNEIEVSNLLLNVDSKSVILQNNIKALSGEIDKMEKIQAIDIKNSTYIESAKMKNLERIFTAGILREWNDSLIEDFLIAD